MTRFRQLAALGVGFTGTLWMDASSGLRLWGDHGHRFIGEAAANALPPSMPEFFRRATAQLAYLNPEPDRWRDRGEAGSDPAMNGAHAPEHYVDFELVPASALAAPDRFAYFDSLRAAGVKENPGLLQYRMLELTQSCAWSSGSGGPPPIRRRAPSSRPAS